MFPHADYTSLASIVKVQYVRFLEFANGRIRIVLLRKEGLLAELEYFGSDFAEKNSIGYIMIDSAFKRDTCGHEKEPQQTVVEYILVRS